jgi:hypothetical protein
MPSFSSREFDHASQAGGRGVMLQSRNRAPAVYGLQVLLAIIAAPGDIAKLAGADVMVQAFQPACAAAPVRDAPSLKLLRTN